MRKISAHYLFTGHKFIKNGVLTLDHNGTVLEVSSLGETITESGGTEFYNGILLPGLVNAHCHLELSHMKGWLPQGEGMSAFCRGIMGLRDNSAEEERQHAICLADAQMQEEGIMAVGDISNTSHSFATKASSPIYYHTFIECLGIREDQADDLLKQAKQVAKQAQLLGLAASLAPHAPYSMSEKLFKASVEGGVNKGILSIHNQESTDEMELFATKQGAMRQLFGPALDSFTGQYSNPIQRVLRYIDPDSHLLLVHNTHSQLSDIQLASSKNRHTTWVLCPRSNCYIENRLPDVLMLHGSGASIAIGTDSLSSNTSLSVLDELKLLSEQFPSIGLGSLLQWATINGAKALKCDHQLGSFDVGKRPGVCLLESVDLSKLRLTNKSRIRKLNA